MRNKFVSNHIIYVICKKCKREFELPVNYQDYQDWQLRRKNIPEAFPYMPIEYRKLLALGYCSKC